MASLRALVWKLPPVRRAVPLRAVSFSQGRQEFLDRTGPGAVRMFRSGTEALAAALERARGGTQGPGEVIVPAYGCPDLVTACDMAGLSARLVDCRSDRWGYDPQALRAALGERTVAVLSVDLLGLAGWDDESARSVAGHAARLVEDCAQFFPFFAAPRTWIGRDVVFSFGRGKPVNALGGGALYSPRQTGTGDDPDVQCGEACQEPAFRTLRFHARGLAFNALSHPLAYGLVERLPFIGLGETRYKPPRHVATAPDSLWSQVGAAILDIESRQPDAMPLWLDYLPSWSASGIVPLVSPLVPRFRHVMLRLPLLASGRAHRDRLVAGLNKLGVGATAMYGTPLNEVRGIPAEVAQQGPFPGAMAFSDRLFTLPVHGYLSPRLAAAADRLIRQHAGP